MNKLYDARIAPADLRTGRLLSVGSRLANLVLPVSDYVGITEKNSLRLDWRLSQAFFDTANQDNWITFLAAAKAGRTPNKYPEVGVINVNRYHLEQHLETFNARPAICYALGNTAMMIGTARSDEIFAPSIGNSSQVSVAMRIGGGDLLAKVGVVAPNGAFWDLTRSAVPGQRLPLADLPAAIPIA